MKCKYIRNSQGVALLAALFVLMVLSILGIGLLTSVDDELKMGKSVENSERALKIAEAGIQVARSTFFDPAVKKIERTEEISSIDGFYRGGYFLAQLKSGFQGNEKWTQWRYDGEVSAHNEISEITTPLFRVWGTGANGVNGMWNYEGSVNKWMYWVNNQYGLVARGTYFSIESASGDTLMRAHDEYTGKQVVRNEGESVIYWQDDKKVTNTTPDVESATLMSAMASFSNYSLAAGSTVPALRHQMLYFTYAGHDATIAAGAADTVSTVRLRAVNALKNNTANEQPAETLWEFDTGIHGVGTASTFFDPDPDTHGDEIIYFAVLSVGEPGAPGTLDINQTGNDNFHNFPNKATDEPEQIYVFAVVDKTIPNSSDPTNPTVGTPPYIVKWAHPFPDPDVVNWTDYPVEHVSGTDGQDPPYVRVPADMTPFMPEDDLLPDYRDGPGNPVISGEFYEDDQWNQVRGNIAWKLPPSLSPPAVNVLYEDSSGNLTTVREDATAASKLDPIIDIYLMYSARPRVVSYQWASGAPRWANRMQWVQGQDGWGPPGYRKPNTLQTRVIALRDRLARSGSSWNWKAAKSRFPEFKWSYVVPGHDPGGTDSRPWNGYGEYTWDTWFDQHVAPMINTVETDQSHREWGDISGAGTANLYPVLYIPYKSLGFPSGSGFDNTVQNYTRGPTTAQGSPVDFSGQVWSDARLILMAVRDTWEDYMAGNQTNPLYASMNATWSNRSLSNPAEPYWAHDHTDYETAGTGTNVANTDGTTIIHKYPAFPNRTVITYNMSDNDTAGNTLQSPFPATTVAGDKIGFPRPYTWSESVWNANVRDAAVDDPWSMYRQGWEGAGFDSGSPDNSKNTEVRGDTAAMCKECLNSDGLIVLPFIQLLTQATSGNFKDADDRADLRLHAINATTGVHQWDFHMPSTLFGDYNNASPAIANNKVFVAYLKDTGRTVMLEALDATDGTRKQEPVVVDENADAVILSPTIANGAVYVATYSFEGTKPPDGNSGADPADYLDDDFIRLFAMSPVLRLVSTGIYPFDYKNYTGNTFRNITLLNHDTIVMDKGDSYIDVQGKVPVSKRKLQVWVTGKNSKWEEVREVLER